MTCFLSIHWLGVFAGCGSQWGLLSYRILLNTQPQVSWLFLLTSVSTLIGMIKLHRFNKLKNEVIIYACLNIPEFYQLDQNRKVYYLATAVYLEWNWIQHQNVGGNDLGLNVFVRHFEGQENTVTFIEKNWLFSVCFLQAFSGTSYLEGWEWLVQ